VSLLQTYMYFLRYQQDHIAMKSLVFGVWTVATLHTALVCHTMYHYLILCYIDPLALINGVWSIYTSVAVGIVICFIVQSFFAKMLWHLTNGWLKIMLALTYAILIVGQLVFGLLFVIKAIELWQLTKLSVLVDWTLAPMCILRVVSDTLTAVTLSYVLYDSRSGAKQTMKLIKALVIYAMERFILTTLVVISQTTVLYAKPQSIWALVIEEVTVHLYINSFLATLNARNHLRKIAHGEVTYTVSMPSFARNTAQSKSGPTTDTELEVSVISPSTGRTAESHSTPDNLTHELGDSQYQFGGVKVVKTMSNSSFNTEI